MASSAAPDIELSNSLIPVQKLDEPLATDAGVEISVARLDLLDPLIAGNKWFKLRDNLLWARAQGYQRLLSFGGPWSNHIHALAWAGREFGFATVGMIRGYETLPLTPCLRDAQEWGMELHFLDHRTYRCKDHPQQLDALHERFDPIAIIPEGGLNTRGVQGCRDILSYLQTQSSDFNTAVLAVGTGATMAGLLSAPRAVPRVLGVSVLKGDADMQQRIERNLASAISATPAWELETDCHFGGYARVNDELKAFIEDFDCRHGIALEPVYTGKMMYALYQRLQRGWFDRGEKVLALHSGGMQGLRGYTDSWPWALARLT